jgi:diaminohydroxyphosphoribosylaminopyrimidine deaminase / 5-amino-6-(5-phosphoribosylamino)uracil reductase
MAKSPRPLQKSPGRTRDEIVRFGGLPGIAPILSHDRAKPLVIAQLGQSLDGRIATPTGESRWINRDAALTHVHRLRATLDAVMVGVGTVAADNPWLNVRHVEGRNPTRVIVDPSGRCPPDARCLDGQDGARRMIIRADGLEVPTRLPDGVEIVPIPAFDGRLDPNAVIRALWDRGVKSMLIEGGAWTVSEFINAGAVDRLHVLVAPMILGSGKTGLCLSPIERLAQALRPTASTHILDDGDVLFDLDLRTPDSRRARD